MAIAYRHTPEDRAALCDELEEEGVVHGDGEFDNGPRARAPSVAQSESPLEPNLDGWSVTTSTSERARATCSCSANPKEGGDREVTERRTATSPISGG